MVRYSPLIEFLAPPRKENIIVTINVRTRDNASPEGKEKIFLACSLKMQKQYLDEVRDDILKARDCAVYTCEAPVGRAKIELLMDEMQAVVLIWNEDHDYRNYSRVGIAYELAEKLVRRHKLIGFAIAMNPEAAAELADFAGYTDIPWVERKTGEADKSANADALKKLLDNAFNKENCSSDSGSSDSGSPHQASAEEQLDYYREADRLAYLKCCRRAFDYALDNEPDLSEFAAQDLEKALALTCGMPEESADPKTMEYLAECYEILLSEDISVPVLSSARKREDFCRKSLELREALASGRRSPKRSMALAAACRTMGAFLYEKDEFDEAEKYYLRALELTESEEARFLKRKEILQSDESEALHWRESVIRSLLDLGHCEMAKGERDNQYYHKAQEAAEAIYDESYTEEYSRGNDAHKHVLRANEDVYYWLIWNDVHNKTRELGIDELFPWECDELLENLTETSGQCDANTDDLDAPVRREQMIVWLQLIKTLCQSDHIIMEQGEAYTCRGYRVADLRKTAERLHEIGELGTEELVLKCIKLSGGQVH